MGRLHLGLSHTTFPGGLMPVRRTGVGCTDHGHVLVSRFHSPTIMAEQNVEKRALKVDNSPVLPRSWSEATSQMDHSRARPAGLICPTGWFASLLSSAVRKNISLRRLVEAALLIRYPVPTRGAYRDRHGRWVRDAMDAGARADERRSCGR